MRIPIERESEVPLYQQIETFLRQNILSGSLAPETRLPSTRQLAKDLGINRITIENAYGTLEADGLVMSRAGSGTYVVPPPTLPVLPKKAPEEPWPLWQQEFQARNEREAAGNHRPGLPPQAINFAGGIGDPHLFPVDDYRRVIQLVLRRDDIDALEYGEQAGYAPLRATIAHILASQGIPAQPDNVLITAGSQQAIGLVAQLLLAPGDAIVVESPTHATALDLFRALRLKVIGVPTDDRGMQVEKLEKLLQQYHPKLIYTIPNFHNPTGTCLGTHRRRQLLALADCYNLPIFEDDYVGDLRYDGRAQPALKSLDPGGRVIYASTFSKMLMPGLRIGFLVADGPVYTSLVSYKHVNDVTTSNLHQRALEAYVSVGRYQAHLRSTCHTYRKRRDAMMEAIQRSLPDGCGAETPTGGLFIWLHLPDGISSEKLLPLAYEEGVSYIPGGRFFTEKALGENYLRLNFAGNPPEVICEGMKRLGKAIRRLG